MDAFYITSIRFLANIFRDYRSDVRDHEIGIRKRSGIWILRSNTICMKGHEGCFRSSALLSFLERGVGPTREHAGFSSREVKFFGKSKTSPKLPFPI